MKPLVSIIIPTHNGSKTLKRAVDSAVCQSYKYVEVIVVDDNGYDSYEQRKTALVMKDYERRRNVYYVCHTRNKNGSAARNTGVCFSRGDFIALLDDDDFYYHDNIEKQMNVFMHLPKEYGATYCSFDKYQNEKKLCTVMARKSGMLLYDVLMHSFSIGSSSLVVRRNVWDDLDGFDESFKRHQDWEFVARIANGYKIQAVENVGYRHNLLFRNSATNANLYKEYREYYLNKMYPIIMKLSCLQRKNIIVSNRFSIALQFLKEKKIFVFLCECWKIGCFDRILYFFIKRVFQKKNV